MYDIRESGKRLKKMRNEAKRTQDQVATELGINIKTYQVLEQGQRGGSVDTLLLLAEYFGVSLDYLIRGTEAGADLGEQLSAIGRERQEKLKLILKNIIRVLEW